MRRPHRRDNTIRVRSYVRPNDERQASSARPFVILMLLKNSLNVLSVRARAYEVSYENERNLRGGSKGKFRQFGTRQSVRVYVCASRWTAVPELFTTAIH